MKKNLLALFSLFIAAILVLSGCGTSANGNSKTIRIGINGSDMQLWNIVQKQVKNKGITLKVVSFSDYVQPNTALNDGSIDLNAFQTITYMNEFKRDHHLNISAIGSTVIAPMGIYSKKYKKVSDIPAGSTIAIPNDVTNAGRALQLLQTAGLIKLKKDFDPKGSIEQIASNPKKLAIKPVSAGQTARALDDVAASLINNGYAVEAGLSPAKDAIFKEDPKQKAALPYVNIIAARTKDSHNKNFAEIVKSYHSQAVREYLLREYKGATVPVNISISKIKNL
ncbi:MetQ/NlpA family ABC transporter substrate-binding protein [Heyndrickxia acidicola]|uniref:Lipoprotein n=1 Tax=Heyndrickxia acidicola TaxID=209389 RepID=A0ABU6MDC1_9BACI|nr:MetQ/NlpA family ABC transporter substrate-binding protein [Heyndrickxia acidicola]MED1202651.1 MetQ/NlpA family ABC transporter substrate-binding protein [Heyndrickxia acidicola]